MDKNSCSKIEGIALLNAIGFEVVLNENTFTIWYENKKIYDDSDIKFLNNPKFLIKNFIVDYFVVKAYKSGVEKTKKKFREFLDLE